MLDSDWTSSSQLQLQIDSAGGSCLGCGAYFQGDWAFLRCPQSWNDSDILRDISFFELDPVVLVVCLWKDRFIGKGILFESENMAVTHFLNAKSG